MLYFLAGDCLLQSADSGPDRAVSSVSEVAKKMGMSHEECDATETDADGAELENCQDTIKGSIDEPGQQYVLDRM